MSVEPLPTAQRRRNVVLGLAIGALCIAQIALFMILFKHNGLPKDPKIWRDMQARDAQRNPPADDRPAPAANDSRPATTTKDAHE